MLHFLWITNHRSELRESERARERRNTKYSNVFFCVCWIWIVSFVFVCLRLCSCSEGNKKNTRIGVSAAWWCSGIHWKKVKKIINGLIHSKKCDKQFKLFLKDSRHLLPRKLGLHYWFTKKKSWILRIILLILSVFRIAPPGARCSEF